MENIQHKTILANGINMHVAEIGSGQPILFLHGFPELWYTWRHQMLSLSSSGYRCIAPDLRGYGETDAPQSATKYTAFHIVGDLVSLLDSLGIDKVFLVGHDFGALMAWYFCLFRPDRIKALVNMSIVYTPRNPKQRPVETLKTHFGQDYYMCRFQEPGWAEEKFARVGAANLMKGFLTSRNPGLLCIPEEGLPYTSDTVIPLPDWLSEDDVNYYANNCAQKGFTGGLNYFRVMDLNWELTAPWTGVQIKVPVKFIVGDLDLTYNTPGVKDYVNKGGFKAYVPLLEEVVILEGVAHFLNEEKPEEISAHILDFIKKF